MKIQHGLLVLAALALNANSVPASVIGGVSISGLAGTPGSMMTDVNGSTATPNGFTVTPGAGINGNDLVEFDLEAYAKHQSGRTLDGGFNIGINTSAGGAKAYDFQVTMKNLVGTSAGSPQQFAAMGDDIGPIDVGIIDTPPTGTGYKFDTSVPANTYGDSTPTPMAHAGILTDSFIRLGGANGGGFAIPWMDTGTLYFTILTPSTSSLGSFALQFTANPEPGTIALAGMAILLIGGGYTLYRRRKMMPVAGALSV